jgi:ROK family protein
MTLTLGLELLDASAAAVAVDAAGTVVARALVPVGGATLAQAALEAVDAVAKTAGSGPLGVAANLPDPAMAAAVVTSLQQRYAGPFTASGPTPTGTAAAVGEAWVGASRGIRDSVYFATAEHVVGGVVRDSAPVFGASRRGAAIAWLSLNPVEREDYRKVGCLEAEVATSGIVRRVIWRIKAGDKSRVADAVNGDLAAITVDDVLSAARSGDGVSISVMRATAKYLGMAAANLVVIADPEMLVVGGIIATAGDLLLEPVRSELARRLPRSTLDGLAVAPALLGVDAPAIGAARLAAAPLK